MSAAAVPRYMLTQKQIQFVIGNSLKFFYVRLVIFVSLTQDTVQSQRTRIFLDIKFNSISYLQKQTEQEGRKRECEINREKKKKEEKEEQVKKNNGQECKKRRERQGDE